MSRPYRGWVNQPSTFQPLHHLHGRRCIVVPYHDGGVELWFIDGALISTLAAPEWVSRCDD